MRPRLLPVVTSMLLLAGPLLAVAPAQAQSTPTCSVDDDSLPSSYEDLDGDGRSDLAVGVPTADAGGLPDVGAVDLHFDVYPPGRTGPAPQRLREADFPDVTPRALDEFGSAVALGAADGDLCADLIVGAPGVEDGRGEVVIARGTPDGVSTDNAIRISGHSAGERFGSAVFSTGSDVWISAPDRTVAGHAGAGAVDHYEIVDGRAVLRETLRQGAGGIAGSPEAGDHFGAALSGNAGWVAIGAPGEDIGATKDAGMVTVVQQGYRSTDPIQRSLTVNQDSPGVGGTAEAGDRFGSSLAVCALTSCGTRVAVGVPGEDVGRVKDAGMVQLLGVPAKGAAVRDLGAITQNSPTISGTAEAGDRFGASVVAGSFVVLGGGTADHVQLAIGAPGEDIGPVTDAGTVTVVEMLAAADGGVDLVEQLPAIYRGSPNTVARLAGTPTPGDRVGAGLSLVGRSTTLEDGTYSTGGALLAIAAPGWDLPGAADAGAISLIGQGPHPDGERTDVRTVTDSGGPVSGEHYGAGAANQPEGTIYTG